jgi:hypothetical protein
MRQRESSPPILFIGRRPRWLALWLAAAAWLGAASCGSGAGSTGPGNGGSLGVGGSAGSPAGTTGGTVGGGDRGGAAAASGGSSGGTAGTDMAGGRGGGPGAKGGASGQAGSGLAGATGSGLAGAAGSGLAGSAGSGLAGSGGGAAGGSGAKTLQQLQSDYVDLRFGMFMHFGILTFCGSQPGDPCPGSWAQANLAINNFAPSSKYNPSQWADTAVAAHMKFGVLTTRHHDGFALWPSAAGTFNVGHIPWKNGQGDVVKDYVNAFRSKGLAPGLYYSIYDSTEGIGNTETVTAAQMSYVTTQITELLTNYGPIPILVIDGWSWKTGHNKVAYQAIRELVKSLQPNCLITDHTHLVDPWEVDIVNFEEPAGAFAPANNTYAAAQ